MAGKDAYPWECRLPARSPRNTIIGSTRSTARCRRACAARCSATARAATSSPAVVCPLVRRRRHDLGDPLRRRRHPLPQPLRRHATTIATRRAAGRIRPSRLRQDAAGRRAGQRLPPAGQRLQHLRGHATAIGCCRCGRAARPTQLDPAPWTRAASSDFGGRPEGLLGPSQDRSRHRRAVQLSASTTGAKTTLTPYRDRQRHRHAPAAW